MKEKILFIAQEGLNKGGVQTVIMNLTKELSSKYQFDIILFTSESRYYDDYFESLGGRIFRISFFNSRNIYVKRLEKFLRKTIGYYLIKKVILRNGPYKAIHCHNSIESSTALSAAKSCGISKRINQIHVVFDDSNSCFFLKMQHEYLKEKMSRLATASIGCSDLACKSFFKDNYQVILNPFDDKLYIPSDKETLFKSPIIIQVGNFSNLKNQLFSIKVFNELLKSYPNAHFNIIGHDYERYMEKMNSLIDTYGIRGNITFFPSDANIPKIMDSSSYLLMPSRTESFGIVLVEAQAMGLKCIASDKIPQESNAGGCIYKSIEDNPLEWAKIIINDFKKTKGAHRKYDMSSFKSMNIASQIEKLYE